MAKQIISQVSRGSVLSSLSFVVSRVFGSDAFDRTDSPMWLPLRRTLHHPAPRLVAQILPARTVQRTEVRLRLDTRERSPRPTRRERGRRRTRQPLHRQVRLHLDSPDTRAQRRTVTTGAHLSGTRLTSVAEERRERRSIAGKMTTCRSNSDRARSTVSRRACRPP